MNLLILLSGLVILVIVIENATGSSAVDKFDKELYEMAKYQILGPLNNCYCHP